MLLMSRLIVGNFGIKNFKNLIYQRKERGGVTRLFGVIYPPILKHEY